MLILLEGGTPNNMHVIRPFGKSGKIIPWKGEAHKKYSRIVLFLMPRTYDKDTVLCPPDVGVIV